MKPYKIVGLNAEGPSLEVVEGEIIVIRARTGHRANLIAEMTGLVKICRPRLESGDGHTDEMFPFIVEHYPADEGGYGRKMAEKVLADSRPMPLADALWHELKQKMDSEKLGDLMFSDELDKSLHKMMLRQGELAFDGVTPRPSEELLAGATWLAAGVIVDQWRQRFCREQGKRSGDIQFSIEPEGRES